MAEPARIFKVWIALLASCKADGIAHVSTIFLASACHLSLKRIDEAISVLGSPDPRSRTLEDEGRRIRRVDGGFFVVNHAKYRLPSPNEGDPNSPGAIRTRRWREKKESVTASPIVTDGDVTGVTSASASVSASVSKRDKDFSLWWNKYPRKVGRADAASAYASAIKNGATPEALDKALSGYLQEITEQKTEERYIKHAATFLRKDRWRDYVNGPTLTERPAPAGQPRQGMTEEEARRVYRGGK